MAQETDEQKELRQEFSDLVNMQPKELEDWLDTELSKSVGQGSDSGESTGHQSGRRIVEIQRKNKDELTESDYDHMKKVRAYIKRHLGQPPSGNVADTTWRYSLMNWGHDPCKSDDHDC